MELHGIFAIRPKNEENKEFFITCGDVMATAQTFESVNDAKNYIDTMIPDQNMLIAMIRTVSMANKQVTDAINSNKKNKEGEE